MDARRPHPLGAVIEEGEGGPRRQEFSGTTRKVATIAGFAANQFHGMGLICFCHLGPLSPTDQPLRNPATRSSHSSANQYRWAHQETHDPNARHIAHM